MGREQARWEGNRPDGKGTGQMGREQAYRQLFVMLVVKFVQVGFIVINIAVIEKIIITIIIIYAPSNTHKVFQLTSIMSTNW